MKTVQYLDAAYLERCRNMSADDILQLLDDNQRLHSPAPAAAPAPAKSKLIRFTQHRPSAV